MKGKYTIHSKIEGIVKFTKEYVKINDKNYKKITTINVLPKFYNKKKIAPTGYCYHPE